MITFILNLLNENLLSFILLNIELDINLLKNISLEHYKDKDNKIILMKFWKNILLY